MARTWSEQRRRFVGPLKRKTSHYYEHWGSTGSTISQILFTPLTNDFQSNTYEHVAIIFDDCAAIIV